MTGNHNHDAAAGRANATTRDEDDMLDMFFSAARSQGMEPSEALMARIFADASDMQPKPAPPHMPVQLAPVAERRSRGFWAGLAAALGGAGALAGLGSAAAAGVLIGFSEPDTLSVLTGGYYETALDAVDLIPSGEDILTLD